MYSTWGERPRCGDSCPGVMKSEGFVRSKTDHQNCITDEKKGMKRVKMWIAWYYMHLVIFSQIIWEFANSWVCLFLDPVVRNMVVWPSMIGIPENANSNGMLMGLSGWWFGTFFIFPYIGFLIIPIDSYFSEGGPTTNQLWMQNLWLMAGCRVYFLIWGKLIDLDPIRLNMIEKWQEFIKVNSSIPHIGS